MAIINGTEGNDTNLRGTSGDDTINGLGGNDYLYGLGGADVLNGGAGFDMIRYESSPDAVSINLATGAASGGDAEGDTWTDVEGMAGSNFGDTLVGDAGDNRLYGFGGDDTLDGGDGDDFLVGFAGADHLIGGSGADTAAYDEQDPPAGVTVNLATGTASGGNAEGDTFDSIENLTGSALDDRLTGNGGVNVLDGGAGDDVVNGGDGNDGIAGSAGADVIDGGAGVDWVDYRNSASVSVNLATGAAGGGQAEGDTIDGIENLGGSNFTDTLAGDAGANRLDGRDGDDLLDGGAGDDILLGDDSPNPSGRSGNDVLNGGDGDDSLTGAAGADTLNGGAGVDQSDYYNSSAGVSINLATGSASGGDAEGDTFDSIENLAGSAFDDTLIGDVGANRLLGGGGNDLLRGGAGADTLRGDTGDDRLVGGDGDDEIDGGAGADTLYGQAGADRFVYTVAGDSVPGFDTRDVIADFSSADGDRIDLSAIDADGDGSNGNTAFTFIGDTEFSGHAGELRFIDRGGRVTVIGADIDGDGRADLSIALIDSQPLTAADFVL
jgi:Ca2+-binding RTX toxin-like protein